MARAAQSPPVFSSESLALIDRPSPLAPLKHETYRSIWIANLASSFGALIQGVGAAWLMTSIADSVDMVALVQAATTLPIMLFSLVGGAMADSFNRRRVMLVAQGFMLVVSAALAAGTYLGLVTPWTLLAFTFLIGCGTALNNPAWQASVGDLVPRETLPAAVALNSIGFNLSRSVGPAVGGAIVAVAGAAAAFALNTVSYLALIFVLLRWRPQQLPRKLPREAMFTAMRAGLRYVAMSPNLGKVLLRSFAFGLTASAVLALLPVVAATLLGGGALTYGLLLGSFGIGAVGGALLSVRLRQALSSENIVRIAFLGFALCAAIAAVSSTMLATAAAMLLGGACWVLALSLFNVTVQLSTPRWVVGRALSIYQTATFGGMAVGSWFWGVVADERSVSAALLWAAAAMLVGGAVGLVYALPKELTLDLDPLDRWKEPHLEIDLQPRSGPIVVTVEYIIQSKDVAAFLEVMIDRKRIRRRDGARRWTLMRDLEHPEIWTESFQTPTWVEYVRHSQRMTKADAGVSEKLRALHSGAEGPRVKRAIERPPSWFASGGTGKGTIDPP
jgi:MFS family permease